MLIFVALWFILRVDLFYVLFCVICSCVFQSFKHCDDLLGEERVNLSAFRTFVRFALVWFCLFPLLFGVSDGLRFVIVALSGLFFYFFLIVCPQFLQLPIVSLTITQESFSNHLPHTEIFLLCTYWVV